MLKLLVLAAFLVSVALWVFGLSQAYFAVVNVLRSSALPRRKKLIFEYAMWLLVAPVVGATLLCGAWIVPLTARFGVLRSDTATFLLAGTLAVVIGGSLGARSKRGREFRGQRPLKV